MDVDTAQTTGKTVESRAQDGRSRDRQSNWNCV